MKENNNLSSLEQAIIDYNEIINEAQKLASEKLLLEMGDKLDSLTKEYLDKINEPEKVENKESEIINKESVETDNINTDVEAVQQVDMTQSTIDEIENEFDSSSNNLEISVDDNDVETITMDDIKNEISKEEEVVSEVENNITPHEKMKKMHEELGEMIQTMESELKEKENKEAFHAKMSEMWGEGYEQTLGEETCNKMYEAFKTKMSAVTEEVPAKDLSVSTDQINNDDEMAEGHGVSLAHNKRVGQESQPRQGKEYAQDKFRLALQNESVSNAKKIAALVKENKELSKKLNTLKAENTDLTKINETAKATFTKMANQMKDMAVFNTNIAYTNNILMNEELSLTASEKIQVVNKFKNVKSINESESTYNELLNQFKTTKVKIDETKKEQIIESATKVVEKTAYTGVDKMKSLIEKLEKRK